MKAHPFPNLAAAARWPPLTAIFGLLALAAFLPDRYGLLPHSVKYPLWSLAGSLAAASTWAHVSPSGRRFERMATTAMLVTATLVMQAALGRVVYLVFRQGANVPGIPLLSTGVSFWAGNVVVFALWYWLVDRGGPEKRAARACGPPDLLFPQAQLPAPGGVEWVPGFFDYLFVAFTASVAFSPTDSAPISSRAKLLMMMQSIVSLVTILIVVARAVNLMG